MGEIKHEIFKEQLSFLKMLSKKLELSGKDYLHVFNVYYVNHASNDEKIINFLNKELGKYIKKGKLNNWVNANINNHSIEELINIDFFLEDCCWLSNELGLGYPSSFSDEELTKLNAQRCHIFDNSICDFHESHDEDDNGDTVFSYTETRRYM